MAHTPHTPFTPQDGCDYCEMGDTDHSHVDDDATFATSPEEGIVAHIHADRIEIPALGIIMVAEEENAGPDDLLAEYDFGPDGLDVGTIIDHRETIDTTYADLPQPNRAPRPKVEARTLDDLDPRDLARCPSCGNYISCNCG